MIYLPYVRKSVSRRLQTPFLYSNFLPLIQLTPISEGCEATSVPVFGSATYAICNSPGLPVAQYVECPVPVPAGADPFTFDSLDCCSTCANTLDCFQGYTDPVSNTCRLDIRTGYDGVNKNRTADCPNYHTYVIFGNPQDSGFGKYPSGFIGGHCAQGC